MIENKKSEIINWINTIENESVIVEINNYIFDFDKELKKAITAEELKKRTTQFIKSLNWKNRNFIGL